MGVSKKRQFAGYTAPELLAPGPILAILACLFSSGCVLTTVLVNKDRLPADRETVRERIVLLPPDIELSEMTAGGLLEPNAEWTAQAETTFDRVIGDLLDESSTAMVRYDSPADGPVFDESDLQAVKLHEVVGQTILIHKYQPELGLPTKQDKFDWSLGDTVAPMRERYGADYAVFIFLRDSFSSGGRVAVIALGVILAAVTGVGIAPAGGSQIGFASLVDLNTGDVIWFNRLARGEGDLRELDSARETLEILFKGFPL